MKFDLIRACHAIKSHIQLQHKKIFDIMRDSCWDLNRDLRGLCLHALRVSMALYGNEKLQYLWYKREQK